jgi:hypothetical protein
VGSAHQDTRPSPAKDFPSTNAFNSPSNERRFRSALLIIIPGLAELLLPFPPPRSSQINDHFQGDPPVLDRATSGPRPGTLDERDFGRVFGPVGDELTREDHRCAGVMPAWLPTMTRATTTGAETATLPNDHGLQTSSSANHALGLWQ